MQPKLSHVYLGVCQVRNPSACPAPESKFSKASSQSASEGQCKSGQFSSLWCVRWHHALKYSSSPE